MLYVCGREKKKTKQIRMEWNELFDNFESEKNKQKIPKNKFDLATKATLFDMKNQNR